MLSIMPFTPKSQLLSEQDTQWTGATYLDSDLFSDSDFLLGKPIDEDW